MPEAARFEEPGATATFFGDVAVCGEAARAEERDELRDLGNGEAEIARAPDEA